MDPVLKHVLHIINLLPDQSYTVGVHEGVAGTIHHSAK